MLIYQVNKLIVIRRTSKDFYENHHIHFQERWSSLMMQNLWNRTFNISYVEYRKQLHRIQQENLNDVANLSGCDVVYSYEIESIKKIPKDTLILPCDDDDWFIENIFDEIPEFENSCRWGCIKLSTDVDYITKEGVTVGDRLGTFGSAWRLYFLSNNHVIKNPTNFKQIMRHSHMNYKFVTGVYNSMYLDKYLSVYNYHLGSLAFLNRAIFRYKLKMQNLLQDFQKVPDLATVPIYFHKLIYRLFELYKSMHVIKYY
jgi:hypothetical protein